MAVTALSLSDMIEEHAARWPARPATCDFQSGQRFDYRAFADRVRRAASLLAERGAGPGARVVWLGQNSHCVLELLLAAGRIGASLAVLNWRQSEEELRFVLDDLEPAVVVWQADANGRALAAEREGGAESWIAHDPNDSGCAYEAGLAAAAPDLPAVETSPDAAQLLLYTAAFSGQPAAAILTRQALFHQAVFYARVRGYSETTVYLNASPLFHVATLLDCLATFAMGGRNLFVPQAGAEEMCTMIDAEGVTEAFVLPPTIEKMIEANRDGRFDLRTLRALPYKPEWNAMVTIDDSAWGKRPYGYGQTETVGYATYSSLGEPGAGGMGRPSPLVAMRIIDEAGDDVADGEVGEMAVRGWTVSPGYWRRPELDRLRYTADGWRRTNDLGRRESDGTISFIGPKGRLIKSAAENIYPAEVERCIAQLAGVAEVGVIGVPDPVWNQSVRAIIVAREGAALDETAVIEHCRAHIASYKKPKSVVFAASLPRTGGALDYRALDDAYGGGGYPSG